MTYTETLERLRQLGEHGGSLTSQYYRLDSVPTLGNLSLVTHTFQGELIAVELGENVAWLDDPDLSSTNGKIIVSDIRNMVGQRYADRLRRVWSDWTGYDERTAEETRDIIDQLTADN